MLRRVDCDLLRRTKKIKVSSLFLSWPLPRRPLTAAASSASTISSPSTRTSSESGDYVKRFHDFWSQASGDEELGRLKQILIEKGDKFDNATWRVTELRRTVADDQKNHDKVIQTHANFLMRREQWSPQDAQSFVDVTANEVAARKSLHDSRLALQHAEEEASRLQSDYMDSLRRRYQEEQLWQDKWRVLGTYGTWALIGLNSCVFLASQLLLQRREVNRLNAIQGMLADHLSASEKVAAHENSPVSRTDGAAPPESNKVSSSQSSEKPVTAGQPQKDDTQSEPKERGAFASIPFEGGSALVKHLAKDLDIPSALFGAAASSLLIGVILLLSRRT